RTILLLVIATLLAYALSPLVTLLARMMPRFLAILLVYLIVLGGIGTLLYFIARTTVDQIISLSDYLGVLLTPGTNGHPSALEQTLSSLGISQDQIASARSQIVSQAEGLAGNVVPFLTGWVGAGMEILGVPYALLLGVLAFVLEFIPVLGTLVSGAICVLLALTKGWPLAIIVLAYFVFVHVIEGDVVGPRIVGKAIGLHPVVSLVALIAGGELFGIWGALFASPIAGVLQAFLVAIWSEWRETHPQEFQEAKDKVAEQVEKNIADRPVHPGADPEPE